MSSNSLANFSLSFGSAATSLRVCGKMLEVSEDPTTMRFLMPCAFASLILGTITFEITVKD
jgi:hypothetical protein